MSNSYVLIAIAVSFAVTFGLRALPFVIFKGDRKMPNWLERLSKVLPSALMAVLIIYCLKGATTDLRHTGLASFIAAAVVAITYKWKHSTVISITSGTVLYMVLIQVL